MKEDVLHDDLASTVFDLFFLGELLPFGFKLLHHCCEEWVSVLGSHGHAGKSFLSVGNTEGCFAFGCVGEINLPTIAVHVAGDEAVGIANVEDGIITSGCGEGKGACFSIQSLAGHTELEDAF